VRHNGLRLGEGGDFTTNVLTKHTVQIYEKLSYEALNRHFCQTAVTSWRSVFRVVKVRSDKVFAVFCVGRVLAVLKILEGKEI
jgi:hypothetical protein